MTSLRFTTPLISVETLAAGLDAPDLVIVDCRFDLKDSQAGRRAYLASHIPGAIHAHLDEDLAAPVTRDSGRHPLPDAPTLCRTLGAWGVGEDTALVAYDESGGMIAARMWWLARWVGHRRVVVLDGGLAAWRAAAVPLSGEIPPPKPRRFHIRPSLTRSVSTPDLVENLQSRRWLVVDARSPERYAGREEPIDAVAGHVPGALNHPCTSNLGPEHRFLPPQLLRERWRERLAGAGDQPIVSMCGSGVTACHNLLALELAGLEPGWLYPGSWSEWIRDPARPVATQER